MMIYIVMQQVKPMKEAKHPALALIICGSGGLALCSELTKERYGIATLRTRDRCRPIHGAN